MTQGHLRVLYAENNKDACFMLTAMLGFSDIDVTGAATAAEACRLGQSEHFDLYLLDSRFSDGSGIDLCRCLRQHSPTTPILFYSGDVFAEDIKNGLAAGADHYLIKPYFAELTSTILQTMQPFTANSRNTA